MYRSLFMKISLGEARSDAKLIAVRYLTKYARALTIGFYLWILFRMYIGVSITKGVPGKNAREEIGHLPPAPGAGPASSLFILSYECAQLHLKSCAPLIFTAAAA